MAVITRSARHTGIASVAALLALQGCSGLSDVGDQPTHAPHAVATAIGYDASDAGGDVSFTVRSQAEVLLTGKDSVESDAPILTFQWDAQNDAAKAAVVTVRNLNTINVSVPAVTVPTDLVFLLTTTESDGDKDTATATLHVRPALDSNRFLVPVGHSAKLRVVAATAQPVAAGGSFTLSLKSRVTYTTRAGVRHTEEFDLGAPITGAWSSVAGSGGDSRTDYRNPAFDFPVPAFNADDIVRRFQTTLPASSSSLPDSAFVDDADIEVVASLTSPTLQADSVLYVVDASNALVARQANDGTGQPTQITLTPAQVETLRITGGGLENKQTTESYYNAIDSAGVKTSLRAWLIENCFDPAAVNFGADAHALYTNDFDLGFGRDMYFRTTRPASCTSTTFNAGDSASVVINYPSLEAAGKKLNPIIAVAMEYKAHDATRSQPGVVTFYAFAPEEGTGEFLRVKSANFDGRGEKAIPGACTECHGGRPLTPPTDLTQVLSTYAAPGNVGATFMPWDLESLLFSDNDPAFSKDPADANLRTQLTRSAQEGEMKKLNAATYATYGTGTPFQCYTPVFDGPCELLATWYGGTDLPSATFKDQQLTPGWTRGGPDNNPPEAEALYLNVIARNCRACHTQRVQDPTGEIDPQFRTYAELVTPATLDLVKSLTFREGAMPAARLTMDRFWTTGGATDSPGDLLAAHLQLAAPAAPLKPLACFDLDIGSIGLSDDTAARTSITRNGPILQTAACSQFAKGFSWELAAPTGSTAALIGSDASRVSFAPDKQGDYDLTLHVTGVDGTTQDTTARFALVPVVTPTATLISAPTIFDVGPPGVGTPVDVDVFAVPNNAADLPSTATFSNPVNVTFVQGADGLVTITPTSMAAGSLDYTIKDTDNESASNRIDVPVQLAGSLVAQNDAGSTTANSGAITIDVLGNDFTAGQDVTVTPSAGSCQGRLGTTATITVNLDKTIDYTPPGALVTGPAYDGASVDPNCTQFDTFTYTISKPPLANSTGTVRVTVDATQTFTGVRGILSASCSGASCHDATAVNRNWALGANKNDTYTSLKNSTPVSPGGPFIDFTEVSSAGDTSLLLLKPAGVPSHTGGNILNTADPGGTIRIWLEEGAYNN